MGKEGESHFGIKGAMEFFRKRLGRANPAGASVEGPELTPAELEEQHLRSLPGSRKHADAAGEIPASQKIPFGDIAEHRKRRGLR